ncbi:MAG: ABC transporter ATP-binding protein [Bacteroidales bacterium]|nr:ABC transporter ATP-binding protein [Bacteroidales bacterium]
MNTVNIEHIAFAYGKEQIFQDLSADFADCEFCALMGPNGSGKSTLLKCIGRMLPFTNGDIKVNGKSIQEYESTELAKLVSYVPQHQDNVFDVSVYDLVMMGLYPYQKKWQGASAQDDRIVREMLDRCNLTHLSSRLLSELSGGEMQRALIARAMAQQTPIMLLDEPLSNLDVAHRYEIMDILAKLNRQGVMILIILHDFSIALEYATHAMLMQDGKILNHDVIKAVLSPENLRNCFHLTEDFVITEEGNIFKTKQ